MNSGKTVRIPVKKQQASIGNGKDERMKDHRSSDSNVILSINEKEFTLQI